MVEDYWPYFLLSRYGLRPTISSDLQPRHQDKTPSKVNGLHRAPILLCLAILAIPFPLSLRSFSRACFDPISFLLELSAFLRMEFDAFQMLL